MSSLRDKINSKLSINATAKPTSQSKPTNFDQTWLKITVVGGQTQLCPIKLNCQWSVPNVNSKPPQLSCKWFNKTENSMSIIDGVVGSYYQPCISDVGTIVHVQCVPELQGSEYDGMPIIKQIGPIKIDPETQQQANDLLSAKKATFSIKIRSSDFVDVTNSQGLIKIQRLNFRVLGKHNEAQKQLINLQISENLPVLKCTNGKSRELEIRYEENGKILVQLTSNKVRDVLVLLVKLINANREELSDRPKAKVEDKEQELAVLPIIYAQKEKETEISQATTIPAQAQNQSHLQTNSHTTKSQVFEDTTKTQDIKQKKTTKQSQKQESLQHNSNPKSQASEEQLKQTKNQSKASHKNVSQIKSSQDLSFTSPIIKKGGSKAQQSSQANTPGHGKQNALQMLQIADLKKQLRANEGQIFQFKKTIGEKNQTIESLKQQINMMKERQSNLSCNYFQLQDQIKKIKVVSEKYCEQVSYYKNQNRILKTQNENIQKKNKMQTQQIFQLEKKLQPFLVPEQKEEQIESYTEIKQKYERLQRIREELEVKYNYMKQEAEKAEERYHELKENVDQIQNEKNFYKKKYENITLEMQNHVSSPASSSKLGKQKVYSSRIISIESSPSQQVKTEQQNQNQFDQYQKQILQLKKKLKTLVQQNNFLREVNTATIKQKKPSSKTHLKVELAEMKKIANRLTEDVTQKDLALQNMKKINREISDKLLQATKMINEYEKKQMQEKHSVKHTTSMN